MKHKHNVIEGFSKEYAVHTLVYYELHESMEEAIKKEKKLKKWNRQWKIDLIEKENPEWKDLND